MDSAIVMDNPWRKFKKAPKRKKQALYALATGLAFFAVLYVVTLFVSEPLCPMKRWLNIRCPGCGLTRGFMAILAGDLVAALKYHVLSVPLFVGVVGYAGCCFWDILWEKNTLE